MWFWNNKHMTNEDIANSCEDAAALLEGHWIRGDWYTTYGDPASPEASYCVEGALAAALGLDVQSMSNDVEERKLLRACPVYAAVQQTVIERVIATEDDDVDVAIRFIEDDGLPYWNDQDWRQEQEVLDVLHATAKRVLGVEA